MHVSGLQPCDERHPEFSRIKQICDDEGIDNSLTQYRWKVGIPTTGAGLLGEMKLVTSTTFLTEPTSQTLDSIYFGPGELVGGTATGVEFPVS